MTRAPFEIAPPRAERDGEAWRRYQRSRRLVEFQRDLAMWERAGLLESPRHAERVRYRREALEHWEAFLGGWTPAKPKQSTGKRLPGALPRPSPSWRCAPSHWPSRSRAPTSRGSAAGRRPR